MVWFLLLILLLLNNLLEGSHYLAGVGLGWGMGKSNKHYLLTLFIFPKKQVLTLHASSGDNLDATGISKPVFWGKMTIEETICM